MITSSATYTTHPLQIVLQKWNLLMNCPIITMCTIYSTHVCVTGSCFLPLASVVTEVEYGDVTLPTLFVASVWNWYEE